MLFGASASIAADYNNTAPFANETRDSRWVVRAGLSINNVTGSLKNEIETQTGKPIQTGYGYDISAMFNKPISTHGFFWGLELALGTRGYSIKPESYIVGNKYIKESSNMRAYNFRAAPLMIGYRRAIAKDWSVEVHIAPYFSYDFTGAAKTKSKCRFEVPIPAFDTDGNITTITTVIKGTKTQKTELDDIRGYNRADLGIQAGGGVWYKRFNLDITYDRGLLPIIEHQKLYSNCLLIRLGYAF